MAFRTSIVLLGFLFAAVVAQGKNSHFYNLAFHLYSLGNRPKALHILAKSTTFYCSTNILIKQAWISMLKALRSENREVNSSTICCGRKESQEVIEESLHNAIIFSILFFAKNTRKMNFNFASPFKNYPKMFKLERVAFNADIAIKFIPWCLLVQRLHWWWDQLSGRLVSDFFLPSSRAFSAKYIYSWDSFILYPLHNLQILQRW